MARRADPCIRQHRRVRTPGLAARARTGSGREDAATVHNLSLGGMYLAGLTAAPARFELELTLPGDGAPVAVQVAVVRADPAPGGLGVRFCDLAAATARRIGAFVAAQPFEPSSPLQRRH